VLRAILTQISFLLPHKTGLALPHSGPVLGRRSISNHKLILRISDHRFASTTVRHFRPRPRSSDPEFVHEFVCHISDARGNGARDNGEHAATGRARQRGALGNGACAATGHYVSITQARCTIFLTRQGYSRETPWEAPYLQQAYNQF